MQTACPKETSLYQVVWGEMMRKSNNEVHLQLRLGNSSTQHIGIAIVELNRVLKAWQNPLLCRAHKNIQPITDWMWFEN